MHQIHYDGELILWLSWQRNMDPPLNVEYFHKVVVAHQECALTLLAFVRELVEKAASFRRIVSQALTDCSISGPNNSALDKFFIHDTSLWISKRIYFFKYIPDSLYLNSRVVFILILYFPHT